MKKLALILLAGASLLGTAGIASAQGYYGGGYGPGPYYGDRYRERYYDDRSYYRGRGAMPTPRQLATTSTVVASAVRVDSPSRMACVSHIVGTNSSSSGGRRSGRPLFLPL